MMRSPPHVRKYQPSYLVCQKIPNTTDEIGHIALGEFIEASVVGGVPHIDPDGYLLLPKSVIDALVADLVVERSEAVCGLDGDIVARGEGPKAILQDRARKGCRRCRIAVLEQMLSLIEEIGEYLGGCDLLKGPNIPLPDILYSRAEDTQSCMDTLCARTMLSLRLKARGIGVNGTKDLREAHERLVSPLRVHSTIQRREADDTR